MELLAIDLSSGATCIAATRDGLLLGQVEVHWSGSCHANVVDHLGPVPEVRRLWIAPASRRAGVGRAVLREAERLAQHRGHEGLGLAVGVDNHGARQLYDRLGYAPVGLAPFLSPFGRTEHDEPCEHVVEYLAKSLGAGASVAAGPQHLVASAASR